MSVVSVLYAPRNFGPVSYGSTLKRTLPPGHTLCVLALAAAAPVDAAAIVPPTTTTATAHAMERLVIDLPFLRSESGRRDATRGTSGFGLQGSERVGRTR